MATEIDKTISIVAPIFAFIIGLLLYLVTNRLSKRKSIHEAINSLRHELETNLNDLSSYTIPIQDVVKVRREIIGTGYSQTYFFTQTASYESLLYSGVFRMLDKETQIKIASLYAEINLLNKMEFEQQSFMKFTMLQSDPQPFFIYFIARDWTNRNDKKLLLIALISELLVYLDAKFKRPELGGL